MINILELSTGVVFVILAIQTYWDLRYKEIPTAVTAVGALIGILYTMLAQRDVVDVLFALLIGAVFLLLGKITREAVGYGDGMLLCMMGLYYSADFLWVICWVALFCGGVVALILLVFMRRKGSYQIPFVPFLLIANIICHIGK